VNSFCIRCCIFSRLNLRAIEIYFWILEFAHFISRGIHRYVSHSSCTIWPEITEFVNICSLSNTRNNRFISSEMQESLPRHHLSQIAERHFDCDESVLTRQTSSVNPLSNHRTDSFPWSRLLSGGQNCVWLRIWELWIWTERLKCRPEPICQATAQAAFRGWHPSFLVFGLVEWDRLQPR
jgi:hypothetical protein